MEASGSNYMRKAFLSHVSTKPLRLIIVGFPFLNESKNFSIKVLSVVYAGTQV
jgi:hypothetical protein